MKNRLIAMLLVMALVVTGLTGCKDFGGQTGMTEASKKDSKKESESTTESESEPEESKDPYDFGADKTEFTPQDFSNYFDDNGHISDIRALDYVTMPDFKAIKIAKADVDPSEEKIENSLTGILTNFRTKNTERAVEDGDQVSIDFVGSFNGEKFDGGSAQDAEVTAGSQDFVDDFLTQIIGHVPGDNFDITVTFPDSYLQNEDLAGQDVDFNITINYVYDVPELTDELVEENKDKLILLVNEEVGSAQELRELVADNLFKNAVFEAARSELLKNWAVTEMPDPAFAAALNMTRTSLYVNYGFSLSDYASLIGYDDETVGTLIYQDAKLLLLHQAIAEQEGWKVTDADYKLITGSDDNEEFINTYGRGYLSQYVLSLWAQDYIVENVTVE